MHCLELSDSESRAFGGSGASSGKGIMMGRRQVVWFQSRRRQRRPFPSKDPLLLAMDKDNRDDFTFAKLSDLKLPVTFRMYAAWLSSEFDIHSTFRSQLEGSRHPRPFTELLDKPELRFHGVQAP
jgi:hypothetical protein